MIARLIAWSARNLMVVLIGTVFAVGAGLYALRTLPLDAIPDLSDVQVIVLTDYPGQAPQVVEDQVTFPLTTAMLTVPNSSVVRGFSFFGVSFVYVIFEDGTDPYWARSRVLEFLNVAARQLPAGVTPSLGPDATGVGWVYQYAVIASCARIRTRLPARSRCRWRTAARCRLAKSLGSSSPVEPRRSGRRTVGSRSTSSSTWQAAISAAMSPKRARLSPPRSSSPRHLRVLERPVRVPAAGGGAPDASSCRSHFSSFFCCSTSISVPSRRR